jgi:hypothetical protein
MRNILLLAIMALLPASPALAEPAGARHPDKPTSREKMLPLKGAAGGNSCAAYGPGFVRVEGTDTCVKIGGAVSIGAGTSSPTGWR